MEWTKNIIEGLSPLGSSSEVTDAETCALASLALFAHGKKSHASVGAQWLLDRQLADGSLCMWGDDTFPKWPTSLALMTWLRCQPTGSQLACDKAIDWILQRNDKTYVKIEMLGHDASIPAWPWVDTTHSWIEPTAFHVIALRLAGYGDHTRVTDATRMLIDRQLPDGGCNYGNTTVLGQVLVPHVQPTGIALTALANVEHPKVLKSKQWLANYQHERPTVCSVAWSAIGLRSQGVAMEALLPNLQQAWEQRSTKRSSTREAALMALATAPENVFVPSKA